MTPLTVAVGRTESSGKCDALTCFSETLNGTQEKREVLASERFHCSAVTLSKMEAGTQALPLAFLDGLADDELHDWLGRYGQRRGFRVSWLNTHELLDQMAERINQLAHELVAAYRLAHVRTSTAKADLPLSTSDRRRA